MKVEWFEIWVDAGLEPPYLLLVMPSVGESERYVVLDPQERGCVVFDASSYAEVQLWLLEDEYDRVTGRLVPSSSGVDGAAT